jgi:hypothetical protein
LGLAVGLRDSFSPTLVPLVLEWFTREMDGEIRPQLLDHLIRQAERSNAYTQHALDAFERGNPDERDRMLATAAGSPLFSRFSAIKYNGGNDLFRGATIVNNKNINIGSIQAGAVAIDGDATQTGTAANTYNAQTLEIIQSRLAEAEREIKSSPVDVEARKEALLTIEAAKKEPTKHNLANAVTAMEKVESLTTKALGTGTAISGIAHLLAQAVGLGG